MNDDDPRRLLMILALSLAFWFALVALLYSAC